MCCISSQQWRRLVDSDGAKWCRGGKVQTVEDETERTRSSLDEIENGV